MSKRIPTDLVALMRYLEEPDTLGRVPLEALVLGLAALTSVAGSFADELICRKADAEKQGEMAFRRPHGPRRSNGLPGGRPPKGPRGAA